MIPGISAGGPISAFTGSGGFDGGTATSGARGSASGTGSTFVINPPTVAATQQNQTLWMMTLLGVSVVALWALSRK